MDQHKLAAVMGELSTLFQGFQTFGKVATKETVTTYLMAIEGCTLPGLHEAVRRLVKGLVPEHDGKGTPTSAILARTVRYEDQRIVLEARYAGRPRIAGATVIDMPITAQQRERGRAILEAIARGETERARTLVEKGSA